MAEIVHFEGFIKDVRYEATLSEKLAEYDFDTFDLKTAKACGLVRYNDGSFAYSRWVSRSEHAVIPSRKFIIPSMHHCA